MRKTSSQSKTSTKNNSTIKKLLFESKNLQNVNTPLGDVKDRKTIIITKNFVSDQLMAKAAD